MIELNMAKFNVKNPQTGEFESLDGASQAKVQSDWNQTDNSAEDFIKNKPALYTKTQTNALLDEKVDKETGKGLSTNDYTTEEKDKLAGIASGAEVNVQADWSQTDSTADDYIKNKPTITDVNDAVLTIQKNGTAVGTFSANAATAATVNITVPVDAADVSALPDTTKYGASLALSIDSSTYVATAVLKDQDGNTLGTAQTIDLPLETVVVGGSYDDTTKKVILTLKNGNTVDFSVADLVAGLQTEITSTNKLDADLVDDTTSVHKFVTAADKTAWNAKSDFSGSYNDLMDKPTIPAAQVNANWNATSGVAQILNKPAIYTKTEINAALAEKLDTADVDADISSTSTNPVQNKAVQAPLARLIDAGAKNLLKITATSQTINGVTFSVNDDGTITANGTATDNDAKFIVSDQNFKNLFPLGTIFFGSGCPTGGSNTTYFISFKYLSPDYGDGTGYHWYPNNTSDTNVTIVVKKDCTVNNLIFKPMLCKAEDHKIDPEFVPYAKSNYELTQDVKQIPSLVDRGAKNLFNQSESYGLDHISNDNGVYTTSGDTLTTLRLQITKYLGGSRVEDLVMQSITSNGVYYWEFTKYSSFDSFMIGHNGSTYNGRFRYNLGKLENGRKYIIRIDITRCSDSNGSFQWRDIMICTAEDSEASSVYQPYALPNTTITPALIKQVNEGSKNLVFDFGQIKNNGCIFTYGSDGRITVTGTKSTALAMAEFISNQNLSNYGLSAGDKIVAVSDNENVGLDIIFVSDQGTPDPSISVYNEIRTIIIPSGRTKWYLRLQIKPYIRGTINESTKPMICDKKLYDIDPTVTPYAKSNYELTQDVKQIPSLVDRGAKNLLNLDTCVIQNPYSGVTVTRAGNELTISSDSVSNFRSIEIRNLNLPINTPLIISGCPSDGGLNKYVVDAFNNGVYIAGQTSDSGKGSSVIKFTTMTDSYIRIRLAENFSFTNKVFRMMVCTTEDWAVSQEFVPFAMSNSELTRKVTELGTKVITVNLSERTFTKSHGGLYYSDKVDISGSFSELYAATMQNFNSVRNISIQPMINNASEGLYLAVCDPSAPSSLSFTGGTVEFVIFGRLK